MRLCSVCLHAVPPDQPVCPYCSAELEAQGIEEETGDIQWEIVRTVSTEIEATLIAGRLRASGVPAFVLSQVDSTRQFTVGALAVAKIYVPGQMLEEAREILATPVDDEELRDDTPSPQDQDHSTDRING
jgi:hypothetical protein